MKKKRVQIFVRGSEQPVLECGLDEILFCVDADDDIWVRPNPDTGAVRVMCQSGLTVESGGKNTVELKPGKKAFCPNCGKFLRDRYYCNCGWCLVPFPGCKYLDTNACTHPNNITPECHWDICPRRRIPKDETHHQTADKKD